MVVEESKFPIIDAFERLIFIKIQVVCTEWSVGFVYSTYSKYKIRFLYPSTSTCTVAVIKKQRDLICVLDSKGAHHQQYFRKEPVSITAAVGSEVTLQCEVENQSGHVQWTKDGYALGKKLNYNFLHFFLGFAASYTVGLHNNYYVSHSQFNNFLHLTSSTMS